VRSFVVGGKDSSVCRRAAPLLGGGRVESGRRWGGKAAVVKWKGRQRRCGGQAAAGWGAGGGGVESGGELGGGAVEGRQQR
jgi:hypothetical protein